MLYKSWFFDNFLANDSSPVIYVLQLVILMSQIDIRLWVLIGLSGLVFILFKVFSKLVLTKTKHRS